MGIEKTTFRGLYVYTPRVFADERGYFFESYNENIWKADGIDYRFVQDNESQSSRGTIRGLHYQIPPFAQAKLIRVTQGEVLDVVVDIRPEEATYGQQYSILLSQENKKQLLIPPGFAHGFVTLSESATFNYKCTNFYSKDHEFGIYPMDKKLAIDWKIDIELALLSEKDKAQKAFGEHRIFKQL